LYPAKAKKAQADAFNKNKNQKNMPSFKLVSNAHSFHISTGGSCESGQCRAKRSSPDKYFDYLFRGTYIFCSCLIVYALLVINSLAVGNDPYSNVFSAIGQPMGVAAEQLLTSAIDLGSQMGDPLPVTIQIYQQSLAKLFVATGETLAKVPEMLLWAPPVKARTLDNYHW
jgi:hypothetical protein